MKITGKTKIVGILGDPVAHSLSPSMQNAAFSAMNLDICYVPLHVTGDGLKAAVEGLRAMQFIGANVTIPHKVSVVEHMDRLAESAALTGAVNTIVNEEGTLIGHNTDGIGFVKALEEKVEIDYLLAPTLIFGAGGAARSISVALAQKGIPVLTIVNRTGARAQQLQQLLKKSFPSLRVEVVLMDDDYEETVGASRIIINATSLGMDERLKTVSVPVDRLSKEHVVCDIVYTRSQEKNPLLVAAQQKGAIILGGVGMLLHQGAEAIQLWTNLQPPIGAMRRAIES